MFLKAVFFISGLLAHIWWILCFIVVLDVLSWYSNLRLYKLFKVIRINTHTHIYAYVNALWLQIDSEVDLKKMFSFLILFRDIIQDTMMRNRTISCETQLNGFSAAHIDLANLYFCSTVYIFCPHLKGKLCCFKDLCLHWLIAVYWNRVPFDLYDHHTRPLRTLIPGRRGSCGGVWLWWVSVDQWDA